MYEKTLRKLDRIILWCLLVGITVLGGSLFLFVKVAQSWFEVRQW